MDCLAGVVKSPSAGLLAMKLRGLKRAVFAGATRRSETPGAPATQRPDFLSAFIFSMSRSRSARASSIS